MEDTVLDLSPENPIPFKQPYLELKLKGGEAENLAPNLSRLFIDVGGKIAKYITKDKQPTDLLIELCKSMAKAGAVVMTFGQYVGSAGPNAILRNGALFYRMGRFEEPPPEVLAYEFRMPTHR